MRQERAPPVSLRSSKESHRLETLVVSAAMRVRTAIAAETKLSSWRAGGFRALVAWPIRQVPDWPHRKRVARHPAANGFHAWASEALPGRDHQANSASSAICATSPVPATSGRQREARPKASGTRFECAARPCGVRGRFSRRNPGRTRQHGARQDKRTSEKAECAVPRP